MEYRPARARQRRGHGDPCHRTRRHAVPGWSDRIRPCSLGWVTPPARRWPGRLVNVAGTEAISARESGWRAAAGPVTPARVRAGSAG